jgi:hypothetical protein
VGTGDLLERGYDGPKQFGAVVGLVGLEHAMESVEELPHDGDQRLHFEFATLRVGWVHRAIGLLVNTGKTPRLQTN